MWNAVKRWGTGCGIEIRGDDLVVAAAKSRPGGVRILGRCTIAGFRTREPREWGAEYARFLQGLGLDHVAATVCLPRREVIVRRLQLPAMSRKETAAAVALQLETLHPFGDEDIYHAYAPVRGGRPEDKRVSLMVVIAESAVIDGYADRFAAAGITASSFSVAAAALHTALRVRWDEPPCPLVIGDFRDDCLELYGEAPGREAWTSEFDLAAAPAGRALQLAYSDLRLTPEKPAALVAAGEFESLPEAPGFEKKAVEAVLPVPLEAPDGFDLQRDLSAMAVALEAACPYLGWRANLLPVERRGSNSRLMYVPTAVLLALLGLLGLAFAARPLIQNSMYASRLETEITRLDRIVFEVEKNSKQTGDAREKLDLLQALRTRTEIDMRIMSELSERIPDTAWLDNLEIDDEGVRIRGTAPEAAPLLAFINESLTVTGAKFLRSLTVTKDGERFHIAAERRPLSLTAIPLSVSDAAAAPAQGAPAVSQQQAEELEAEDAGQSAGASEAAEGGQP